MTGRVVYFTMGLPIVTTIIFVGRALSLENAREGVDLVWRTWRGGELAKGSLWQTAVGQVLYVQSFRISNHLLTPEQLLHRYRLRILHLLRKLQPETRQCCHGRHPDLW